MDDCIAVLIYKGVDKKDYRSGEDQTRDGSEQ
jgi:hypothetical protein